MIKVHLLVPTEVIKRLSARFILQHENGSTGYFVTLENNEVWNIVKSLFGSGYRVDIKPGDIIKLVARKEIT